VVLQAQQAQQALVLKVGGVNEERNYLRKEERNLSGQKDVEEGLKRDGLKRDGLNIANVILVYATHANVIRLTLRKLNIQGTDMILILSEKIYMRLFKEGD